eukprot:825747-Amphidinium_carterae.3
MLVGGMLAEWGDRSFQCDKRRRRGRRRRTLSKDFKNEMEVKTIHHEVSSCTGALLLGGACASSAKAWNMNYVQGYVASCWRQFDAAAMDVLSVCFDGTRLGSPAEVTIVYAAADGARMLVTSWLAPMVRKHSYTLQPIKIRQLIQ